MPRKLTLTLVILLSMLGLFFQWADARPLLDPDNGTPFNIMRNGAGPYGGPVHAITVENGYLFGGAGSHLLVLNAESGRLSHLSDSGQHAQGIVKAIAASVYDGIAVTGTDQGILSVYSYSPYPSIAVLTGTHTVPQGIAEIVREGSVFLVRTPGAIYLYQYQYGPGLTYLNSVPFSESVLDLAVSGTHAYVLLSSGQVSVIDFGDPSAPARSDVLPNVFGSRLAVNANRLYVSSGYAVDVYDISSPTEPQLLCCQFSLETGYAHTAMVVTGGYGYLAASNSAKIAVVDMRDPANMAVVTEITTLNTVRDLTSSAGYLYAAMEGRLQSFALTNPAAPTYQDEYPLMPTSSYDIDYQSGEFFFASCQAGIFRGQVGLNFRVTHGRATPECAISLDAAGSYVYVADDNGGLRIYTSSTLTEVGVLPLAGVMDVKVVGTTAYVLTTDQTTGGLYVVNVANPSTPGITGFVRRNSFNRVLAVQGNYAYISGFDFSVVDISIPSAPVEVGSLTGVNSYGIAANGSMVYLSKHSKAGYTLIDVSQPTHPQITASPLLVSNPQFDVSYDVAVFGNYLAISGVNYQDLYVVDITDPYYPCVAGYYPNITGWAVARDGNNNLFTLNNGLNMMRLNRPPGNTYAISGQILGPGGQPVEGAGVSLNAGMQTTLTDESGQYAFGSLKSCIYAVVPSDTDYTFSPAARQVTITDTSLNEIDFTATPVTHAVTGWVRDSGGNGIAGVTISDGAGHQATTTLSGSYLLMLPPGSHTLAASKSGYTFSPASQPVIIADVDVGEVDFTGAAITYTISGMVRSAGGAAMPDVRISDDAGHSTTTAVNGTYTLSGLVSGTYHLFASYDGYNFSPSPLVVTLLDGDVSGQDFTATEITYAIHGSVTDGMGAGLAEVTISAGAGHSATTATDGTYTLIGLPPGEYLLTPSRSGYTFTPAERTVTVSGADLTKQDFTGALVTFSISGTVRDGSGNGIASVALNDGAGHTALTAGDGSYTFSGLVPGSYTLTPTRNGYTFSPVSRSAAVSNTDLTGQDFTGAMLTYSVSGMVKDAGGTGIAGVTVSDGAGHSATTSSNGVYILNGLVPGSYTLTPSKSGYTFTPPNLLVTVSSSNLTGQHFTGGAVTYSISGLVRSIQGVSLAGVTVSDGAGHTVTTAADGSYTLSGLLLGSYSLTPILSGYTFTPSSLTIELSGNATSQNFIGERPPAYIDLTISLYRTPAISERAAYEAILGYFADSVFEITNGAFKVRKLTIYQNGSNPNANILWSQSQWPSAHVSGIRKPNSCHIFMGDVFPFGGPGYNALDAKNWKGAGYALGHEFGHYYFGLYDEYKGGAPAGSPPGIPRFDDIAVKNSVMNNQWDALTVSLDWLNFSVPLNTLNGQGRTAQDRMYSSSGWETLARPVSQDPPTHIINNYLTRLYYPELTPVAPLPGYASSWELSFAGPGIARSALSIVWEGGGGAAQADDSLASAAQNDSSGSAPYQASIYPLEDSTVVYPDPALLVAQVSRGDLIARTGLSAVLTLPDGSTKALNLLDDGVAPDSLANDGLYTGFFPYTMDGEYTASVVFDNAAGVAEFTETAAEHAVGPNGEVYVPVPQPVGVDFTAAASVKLTVVGVKSDDHAGSAPQASDLPGENGERFGRIDFAGDIDVFRFTPGEPGEWVVRVAKLAQGMQPQVLILAADGFTVLGKYTVSANRTQYFYTFVDPPVGEAVYVVVMHQDAAAIGGIYAVSAGRPLVNETRPRQLFMPVVVN